MSRGLRSGPAQGLAHREAAALVLAARPREVRQARSKSADSACRPQASWLACQAKVLKVME